MYVINRRRNDVTRRTESLGSRCISSSVVKVLILWACAILLVGGLGLKCILGLIRDDGAVEIDTLLCGLGSFLSALVLIGVVNTLDTHH